MQITNLTRANEIGANCYHVQAGDHGFLLDSGTHPKLEGNPSLPRLDVLSRKPLDALLLSHSHLDHLGSLPVVMGDHPETRAYMTYGTSLIADRALHNSASVMIKQRNELHLPEYPFFTHGQVDHVTERFEVAPYGRTFELGGAEISFHEAGHVQGAAGIWIESGGHSLFYTGDVRFADMKITRGAQFPDRRPDSMLIECTRGNTPRTHDWDYEMNRLANSILETYARGGSVLIPCFALGKTQEALKIIHDLIRQNVLPDQLVYIGGLASTYNEIYDELSNRAPRVCPGFKIENSLNTMVLEHKEALKMKLGRGRLMLLSSGMMTPRTMSYLMTQRMASDERHSIFFIGYVDPDSPAGKVQAAGQGGRADLGGDVGEVDLKCRVDRFNFSSHCERDDMIDYVLKIRPRNVLLTHGETASLEWFRNELSQRLPDSKIIIPPSGETIEL